MDPKIYQLCESCAARFASAKKAKHKKLPKLELATHSPLVHDGKCAFVRHLCDRHFEGVIDVAEAAFGHNALRDRVIAFPAQVH